MLDELRWLEIGLVVDAGDYRHLVAGIHPATGHLVDSRAPGSTGGGEVLVEYQYLHRLTSCFAPASHLTHSTLPRHRIRLGRLARDPPIDRYSAINWELISS